VDLSFCVTSVKTRCICYIGTVKFLQKFQSIDDHICILTYSRRKQKLVWRIFSLNMGVRSAMSMTWKKIQRTLSLVMTRKKHVMWYDIMVEVVPVCMLLLFIVSFLACCSFWTNKDVYIYVISDFVKCRFRYVVRVTVRLRVRVGLVRVGLRVRVRFSYFV